MKKIRVQNNDSDAYFVHELADVQTKSIGKGTRIWQFCVILSGARIGENVNICSHCFIENEVEIGSNVTIKNGIYLFDGVVLEDSVFIGPNVTFTNDIFPRSGIHHSPYHKIIIERGASVGGGAVLLPGVRIGRNAMIGAGAIVTRNIPADSVVYGDAARVRRKVLR